MSTIRILIVPPDGKPYPAEIPHTLDSMQSIVKGEMEVLYPFDDPVGIICNESGKLTELSLNRALRDEAGKIYDIIVGTFFIAGLGIDNFASLSDELLEKYTEKFRWPETFTYADGTILAIPYDPTASE